jgi:hypothetical protein
MRYINDSSMLWNNHVMDIPVLAYGNLLNHYS